MQPKRKASERGSALIQAMIGVGLLSGLATSLFQLRLSSEKSNRLLVAKESVQKIGRSVQGALLNPEILRTSASLTIGEEGNKMLYYCLGLNKEIVQAAGGKCDPSQTYEFLLVPGPDHYLGKKTEGKNCANEGSISCYIAGSLGGKTVGYNLNIDASELSEEYPFAAKVSFKPRCVEGEAETTAPCFAAKSLELFYEVKHHKAGTCSGKPNDIRCLPQMQTYPKEKIPFVMPMSKLIGDQCNPGAKFMGIDLKGSILCECRQPYVRSGRYNDYGPICLPPKDDNICPPQMIEVGKNEIGEVVCDRVRRETIFRFNQKTCLISAPKKTYCGVKNVEAPELPQPEAGEEDIVLDTLPSPITVEMGDLCVPADTCQVNGNVNFLANRTINCSNFRGNQVGGWPESIRMQCSSFVKLLEVEGEKLDAGAVAGVGISGGVVTSLLIALAFIAVAMATSSSVPIGGWIAAAIGGIIAGILATLVAILIFFQDDWNIPATRPLTMCEMSVNCKALKRYDK